MNRDINGRNRQSAAYMTAEWRKLVRFALSDGPKPWMAYSACCRIMAVIVLVYGLIHSVTNANIVWFCVLLGLAVIQAEISRQIERERVYMAGNTHIDVVTVWVVAGAAMLAPGWAALLAVAIYVHLWFRVWRQTSTTTVDRTITTASVVAISAAVPSWLVHATSLVPNTVGTFGDLPADLVVAGLLEVVNLALIAPAIYLRTRSAKPRDLFGSRSDNWLELITLCLGVMAAVMLQSPWPGTVAIVFPPLLILHRAALTEQMEHLAITDAKTNTLNSSGWDKFASRALRELLPKNKRCAMLMIDVDNFKQVNDTYGHMAGDDVLKEIANTIVTNVRTHDVVGRYGGEEFVVLLPDVDPPAAADVGERIRTATEGLRIPIVTDDGPTVIDHLTVSVGLATCADVGSTAAALLDAADSALYRAKQTGRNRLVRWAETQP